MDTIERVIAMVSFDRFLPKHLDFFILDCPRYYLAWNVEHPTTVRDKSFYFEFSTEKKKGKAWFFVKGDPVKYYVYFADRYQTIFDKIEGAERIDLIRLLNEKITK